MPPAPPIAQRKADHLAIAASGRADFVGNPTLLDEVHLIHQALPELAVSDIDLRTTLCGQTLAAPLFITGMTGGTATAQVINRDLATAAERCQIGFGVGSQRAMAEHPELASTYQVRDVAPTTLLVGNLGVMQARALGVARCGELVRAIGANALAVHLNPAQELIQTGGDRDFTGAIDTIATLVESLGVPVVVKETGCGLSGQAIARLLAVGVTTVDVAGAGGTSWIAVEAERATDGNAAALGRELWDWGVPTAASIATASAAGLITIGSGGIRTGLDIVRALALGATVAGGAAPLLRAQQAGGVDGVVEWLTQAINVVRAACVLTGVRRPGALATAPRHLGPALQAWIAALAAPPTSPGR